ncbi:hypothetical protein STANM309S_06204 [Streptomyces tanashiensis]
MCEPLWDSYGSVNLSLGSRTCETARASRDALTCPCRNPVVFLPYPHEEDPHMSVMRAPRRRTATAAAVAVAALALGSLTALPAAAAPAAPEGVIENAGAEGTVPGSYIVTLDESAQAETAEGRAVAARFGAKIKRTFTSAINGYSVEVSEAQARKLAADPAVRSVVQNRVFHVDGTQPSPPSWGLDRIDQKALPLTRATPTRTPRARASRRTSSTPASASPTATSAAAPPTATTPSTTTTPPRTATVTAPTSPAPSPATRTASPRRRRSSASACSTTPAPARPSRSSRASTG